MSFQLFADEFCSLSGPGGYVAAIKASQLGQKASLTGSS